jgi:hypothetical protein
MVIYIGLYIIDVIPEVYLDKIWVLTIVCLSERRNNKSVLPGRPLLLI